MNPLASARALITALARDAQLARRGAVLGWYTRTHYRGRMQSRRGGEPEVACTRLNVSGQPVEVFLTPPCLGSMYGVFVEDEYDLASALPKFQPATILDLGANVGMAASYLHAKYPTAQFVCVEPDPRNLPLLRQTIAANNITAAVVPVAVAAEAGTLRLRMGENPTCSALETSPMHQLESSVEVAVTTVPELLDRAAWERIDLLKVDVEGTEQELFRTNNDWLRNVGVILVEIHPNTTPEEIGGFLRPFGFTLSRLGAGSEPVYLARRGDSSASS